MFSKVRRLLYSLIILSSVAFSPTLSFGKLIDDDIRIDLPLDAHVRVENLFGNVSAEVWSNKYVSVSATVEGSSLRFKRSPIVIDNRGKLLSISVVRTPLDPVAAIHLTVKVPDTSHLEVLTTSGGIVMRGLSASASLRSGSGDIETVLPAAVSANISARSARGTIRSGLGATPASDGHSLSARLGSASRYFEAETDSGQILLSEGAGNALTDKAEAKQPELAGPDSYSKAAGTPAGQTETGEISEGDV